MKETEDSDVVCFEVEEPIVNAIVKIDVYSNKEGAKNVKIGRFCIDCSGMPKTVCKDSRSSFFKINQRTGVPLSLGNGKFKLLRSPKKAKVKASVNVDANGEFTFAGKSKLKPLSTLSGFTATESADRSGTTVTARPVTSPRDRMAPRCRIHLSQTEEASSRTMWNIWAKLKSRRELFVRLTRSPLQLLVLRASGF